MKRRKRVAVRETMFELATCAGLRWRSFLIVVVRSGGNVYLLSFLNTVDDVIQGHE